MTPEPDNNRVLECVMFGIMCLGIITILCVQLMIAYQRSHHYTSEVSP